MLPTIVEIPTEKGYHGVTQQTQNIRWQYCGIYECPGGKWLLDNILLQTKQRQWNLERNSRFPPSFKYKLKKIYLLFHTW
jgi:hypothetical protein